VGNTPDFDINPRDRGAACGAKFTQQPGPQRPIELKDDR
jgi:hypothetical protein